MKRRISNSKDNMKSLKYLFSFLFLTLYIPGNDSVHHVFEAVPSTDSGGQRFMREPLDQIAAIGEHVTLPCRVVNKLGALQWTRDDFGMGTDRNLSGYKRYSMTGSDDEGKTIIRYLGTIFLTKTFKTEQLIIFSKFPVFLV